MSLSQLFSSTHRLGWLWWVESVKGLTGSTGRRGSPRTSSSCGSTGERAQATWLELGWIFWGSSGAGAWLELEEVELKSRGLVAHLGVDMNLRLFCYLGSFYREWWWGPSVMSWGHIMNAIMNSMSDSWMFVKTWNKCSLSRNVFFQW